jgi:hypothetical protein
VCRACSIAFCDCSMYQRIVSNNPSASSMSFPFSRNVPRGTFGFPYKTNSSTPERELQLLFIAPQKFFSFNIQMTYR